MDVYYLYDKKGKPFAGRIDLCCCEIGSYLADCRWSIYKSMDRVTPELLIGERSLKFCLFCGDKTTFIQGNKEK